MAGKSAMQVIGDTSLNHAASLTQSIDSLAGEADELILAARTRVGENSDAIARLNTRVEELRQGPEDSLNGVRLLDTTNPDNSIALLRQRSTLWNNGLLDDASQTLIEAQIRGQNLSARAVSFLGHPIASAKVPTAKYEFIELLLVPDRVVSPPQGFTSLDDARSAAKNIIADQPGSTIVIVDESTPAGDAYHLLKAPVDTSPRQITVASGIRKRPKTSEKPVTLNEHLYSIPGFVRSDGIYIGKARRSGEIPYWPTSHTTPLSGTEMDELGLVHTHRSDLQKATDELNALSDENTQIRDAMVDLQP